MLMKQTIQEMIKEIRNYKSDVETLESIKQFALNIKDHFGHAKEDSSVALECVNSILDNIKQEEINKTQKLENNIFKLIKASKKFYRSPIVKIINENKESYYDAQLNTMFLSKSLLNKKFINNTIKHEIFTALKLSEANSKK